MIETERLRLRNATLDDAAFIAELVNEPAFLQFIGDKAIRTLEDAQTYIRDRLIASYAQFGFGQWVVGLKESDERIGLCGLIKREGLDDVDIGYSLLARFRGRGYATEAAAAVKAHALGPLGLPRLAAITTRDNQDSIHVLAKIGLRADRLVTLPGGDEELILFTTDSAAI